MKKLVIIGGGGHALELVEYVAYINASEPRYEIAGILDDVKENYAANFDSAGAPAYLGPINEHKPLPGVHYLIAVSAVHFRRRLFESLTASGAQLCNLIHPHASVSPSANLGVGNVVAPQVIIGPKVTIGNFNLLNGGVAIGHHSVVGNNNILSPNCSLSGGTTVGDDNFFGMNVSTFPKLTVGNGNTISAGMVLDKAVTDNNTVFYRFKERVLISPQQ
jgi:sugar O-acyltransferase (sialic acid O-acetyltransferase NeuD family)